MIKIVAGISHKGLNPRVWDVNSPYHLTDLKAVMISYADFAKSATARRHALMQGIHNYLDIPKTVKIYLDNGAFYFLNKQATDVPRKEYEEFIAIARPDWYVIPQDYIPSPKMTDAEQLICLKKTMAVNKNYTHDGFVPVIHISRFLDEYLRMFVADKRLTRNLTLGLGGIVPNLLRAQKAMSFQKVLDMVRKVRRELHNHDIHVFGIGGTVTLHIASLLRIDSVDSSGWRNRAARGIIQLPGRGDRIVTNLGNWRVREASREEWELLRDCQCPACLKFGRKGLKENKMKGFNHRATHNLWVLLEEAKQIDKHIKNRTYNVWYQNYVNNSMYRPMIDYLLAQRE